METFAQIARRWSAISPEKIAVECSPRHIQSVLEEARFAVLDLTQLAVYQGHAIKASYHFALQDARRAAHRGQPDERSRGVIDTLLLLHLISDIEALAYRNEIAFLLTRHHRRWVESITSIKA